MKTIGKSIDTQESRSKVAAADEVLVGVEVFSQDDEYLGTIRYVTEDGYAWVRKGFLPGEFVELVNLKGFVREEIYLVRDCDDSDDSPGVRSSNPLEMQESGSPIGSVMPNELPDLHDGNCSGNFYPDLPLTLDPVDPDIF